MSVSVLHFLLYAAAKISKTLTLVLLTMYLCYDRNEIGSYIFLDSEELIS